MGFLLGWRDGICTLTIDKVALQHDFIVAEQITAKAILGLDFLEAKKCILDLAGGKMQITDKTL